MFCEVHYTYLSSLSLSRYVLGYPSESIVPLWAGNRLVGQTQSRGWSKRTLTQILN